MLGLVGYESFHRRDLWSRPCRFALFLPEYGAVESSVLRQVWGWPVAISDSEISRVVGAYLERYPDEAEALAEPVRLLPQGQNFAWRRTFPMHVTVGALLVRGDEILLVDHRAYGIILQPGGHLEPEDATLIGAALRELVEESGADRATISPVSQDPVYIEFGPVPARPAKDEPPHFHLDIGFAFTTMDGDVGRIQESEITGAAWYPFPAAESLVGDRIARVFRTLVRN